MNYFGFLSFADNRGTEWFLVLLEKSFVWSRAFLKSAPHMIPDVIKRLKVCIFSVIEILTVKKPF